MGIIFLVAKFFTAFYRYVIGVLAVDLAVILAQKESFGLYSVCVISGSSGCRAILLPLTLLLLPVKQPRDGAVYVVRSVLQPDEPLIRRDGNRLAYQ